MGGRIIAMCHVVVKGRRQALWLTHESRITHEPVGGWRDLLLASLVRSLWGHRDQAVIQKAKLLERAAVACATRCNNGVRHRWTALHCAC